MQSNQLAISMQSGLTSCQILLLSKMTNWPPRGVTTTCGERGAGRRGEHLHASVHAPASSRRAHDLLATHARDERPATPRHIPIVLIRIPDEGHNQHALSMQWRDTSQFPNRPHHATISMQSSCIQDQRERAQSACNQPAIIQDQRESARVVVAIAVEVPLVACVARRVGGHEYGVRHLMRDVIDVQSAFNQHAIIM
jgi:hypothetical protein